MTMQGKPDHPPTMLELLPRAVAAVVSLSAVGYFIGWREATAYFNALGAPWAASSVPSLVLLQSSASAIVTVVAACFFALVLLLDQKISARTISWICAISLCIAALLLAASQGLFGNMPPESTYGLASVGAMFYAVSAGLTLAELMGHLQRSPPIVVSSGYLWLVYWFVLPGLFWAPERLGEARALRDGEPRLTTLPVADLGTGFATGEWRLVQLVGDKALLISLAASPDKRSFKFVEANDIKAIGSTAKVAKP